MDFNNREMIHKENQKNLKEVRRVTNAFSFDLIYTTRCKEALFQTWTFVLLFGAFFSEIALFNCMKTFVLTNLSLAIESYATANQSINSISKLIYLWVSRKHFRALWQTVETGEILYSCESLRDTSLDNKILQIEANEILKDSWRFFHLRMYFYIVSVSSIIGFYFANALLQNSYHQLVGTANYTNMNVFPTYYPIYHDSINDLPYYPIMFYCDTCADFLAGVGALSFDGIYLSLTSHAATLLSILAKTIKFSTSKEVPKEKRLKIIKDCILFQDKIYKFCEEINDTYEIICLVFLSTSLIVVGGVLFTISTGFENELVTFIRMVFYILALGYEVVVFTQNGQIITNASEEVAEAWYSSYWYEESEEFKKYIYMMLIRSNKLIYMTGWGFLKLNLATLLAIFRTSGSYFLLLRNITG